MKTLLKLIRERRSELEAKDLEGITDEMRITVLCEVTAAARRNPGGQEAAKLRQIAECGPECRGMVEEFTKMCEEATTSLRELVRELAGLEVKDDHELAEVVHRLVATSHRYPDRAERIGRFRNSGAAERAVLAEYANAGPYVSRETGRDALTRGIHGMQPEGGATEKPEKAAPAACPAGAEEPGETLFDLEAAGRVTTHSPVSYLRPVRSGKNQSWHKDKPDPVNPGTGWMRRR